MVERKGKRAYRAVLNRRRREDVRDGRNQEVWTLLEATLGKGAGAS